MSLAAAPSNRPLGIIAGGGIVPVLVAASASASGRPVHVATLEGWAEPALDVYPHARVGPGSIGRIVHFFRSAGCQDLVLVGGLVRPDLKRPSLRQLRADLGAVRHLPMLLGLGRGGDDRLLGRVVRLFEREGFRIVGAHEVAPELLAPEGLIAGQNPGARAAMAIRLGREAAWALGRLDIGQAVVASAGRVVAVEAAEGTDLMLERVGAMRSNGRLRVKGRDGVLVKVPKPNQDLRIDMPTIGERTIVQAAQAGLAGIAIAAGGVLVADRGAVIAAAEREHLFVLGLGAEKPT